MPGHAQQGWNRAAAAAAAIALLAALCFWPAVRNGFVYDDAQYIGSNPDVRAGLSAAGVRWALTSFAAANWHPLTWLSHLADVSLFGLAPAGHHATSIALHAAAAALLLVALQRATGRLGASLLVAALFAVHPLRVESVAWVAERKDVLSGLLFFAALGAYVGYARRPAPARYLAVALLTALALAAKPMAVTLPFVMLVLDWWPLGRIGAGAAAGERRAPWRPWLEKAPLVALALGAGVLTLAAQRSLGAVQSFERLPLPERLANALWSYAAYVGAAAWPARLAPLYPHPGSGLGWLRPALAAAGLLAVTALALAQRRRPYLLAGWLWYLGTLLPVIGVVQVGVQALADRYTYLPLVGIAVAGVWAASERAAGRARAPAAAAALVSTLALGAATRAYLPAWRDDLALWRATLAVTADNYVAESNYGAALARGGRLDEALEHYQRALRIEPRSADTWNNLGLALTKSGRAAEAVAAFERAVTAGPAHAEAWNNLGAAYGRQGRWRDALAAHQKAVGLQPRFGSAYYNLGLALLSLNDREGARQVLDALQRVDAGWASRLAPFVPAAPR